jgi:uncharacterized SAM-binding protein YcdF (DUF218 family)
VSLSALLILLPSIPAIRVLCSLPLVVSDSKPNGDAVYILSAGEALRERIAAASDLYHRKQAGLILLARDDSTGPYNFKEQASWTTTQWAVAQLEFYGIPNSAIRLIDVDFNVAFGTLNEARTLAKALPHEVASLILVTSPAHTRRSLLAFKRSLPGNIRLSVFSATGIAQSIEFYRPIWLEYLKLAVYWIIA